MNYNIHSLENQYLTLETTLLIRRETFHEDILKTVEIDTTTKQKQKHGKRFL